MGGRRLLKVREGAVDGGNARQVGGASVAEVVKLKVVGQV